MGLIYTNRMTEVSELLGFAIDTYAIGTYTTLNYINLANHQRAVAILLVGEMAQGVAVHLILEEANDGLGGLRAHIGRLHQRIQIGIFDRLEGAECTSEHPRGGRADLGDAEAVEKTRKARRLCPLDCLDQVLRRPRPHAIECLKVGGGQGEQVFEFDDESGCDELLGELRAESVDVQRALRQEVKKRLDTAGVRVG